MALNIQQLINQINERLVAVDSATPSSELNRLVELAQGFTTSGGVFEYQFEGDLPPFDSSQLGRIAFVRDGASFYYGKSDSAGWSVIPMVGVAEEEVSFNEYLQGTQYGYVAGGSPVPKFNIEQFSMTNDVNSSITASLARATRGQAGASSRTHGYVSGGAGPPSMGPGSVPYGNDWIQRFQFVPTLTSVQVGTLASAGSYPSASATYTQGDEGFRIGGYEFTGPSITAYNFIQKFPFSSETTATQVAAISAGRTGNVYDAGISGYTRGYATAGHNGIARERWEYVSTATSTAIGNLSWMRYGNSTASSDVSGYAAGGLGTGPQYTRNIIDKFPFVNDEATSTDVGDLPYQMYGLNQGSQSTTNGYASGGTGNTASFYKINFASDGNATNAAYLTQTMNEAAGHQL